MLWILAFHIIFVVTWFAGLFYLPRLYVYHADTKDVISIERFKLMERRLYYGITTPGAVLTTVFGLWLFSLSSSAYLSMGWFHFKLFFVLLLWIYHLYLGHLYKLFKRDANRHSTKFYRIINEIPTILLVVIVILVVVKP